MSPDQPQTPQPDTRPPHLPGHFVFKVLFLFAAPHNRLEAARLALSRGDAVGALRVLQEHAAQAPASGMAEERQALQVLSLARAGRLEEARSSSLAFAALYPDSLFLDRVRAATP